MEVRSARLLPFICILVFTLHLMMVSAIIFRDFWPSTTVLLLTANPELGYEGLKAVVEGMEHEQLLWALEKLSLRGCGLGGTGKCFSGLIL